MVKKSETSSKSGLEKRVHARRTLRSQVIFEDESGEGFIYFYSTDLSVGGIFLESDIPLRMGTQVFLSFNLRPELGDMPIRATGKVVRVERDPSEKLSSVGMGVQFMDIADEARKIIQNFVEQNPLPSH